MSSILEPQRVDGAHTLPFELASKIFIDCLPLRRRVRPRRNRAPLHLTQVCSRWRSIALATPQLWTSIHLELSYGSSSFDGIATLFGDDPVDASTASLLELWFARAGGHALSISLICSKGTFLDSLTFAVLAAYCSQWGRLELAVEESDFRRFNESVGPFPLLQSLSLQLLDSILMDPHRLWPLEKSPNLRALQVWDHFRPMVLSRPGDLPRGLTALQMKYAHYDAAFLHKVPFNALVWIFEHFPRLLHFTFLIYYYEWPPVSSRLVHPLKSLVLPHGCDGALQYLEPPALEYLQVTILEAMTHRRLVDFLSRSGSHLTHLALDFESTTSAEFALCLSVLPVLPALTTLELRYRDVGSEWKLQTLAAPALRNLIVTDASRAPNYQTFLTLVRSAPQLRRAELQLWSRHEHYSHMAPEADILVELTKETERGLIVLVTTQTWEWPLGARDMDPVGDLDDDIFFPLELRRPYSFSPF
ncbi:hypothetical protein C8R46DRAFT_609649 [Mycena filopes]|nr:hypothetical protein C8R46DRAFT_609649 [Mycena filopes]